MKSDKNPLRELFDDKDKWFIVASLGFVKMPLESAFDYVAKNYSSSDIKFTTERVSGSFAQQVSQLLPLADFPPHSTLFNQCRNGWVSVVDNARMGDRGASAIAVGGSTGNLYARISYIDEAHLYPPAPAQPDPTVRFNIGKYDELNESLCGRDLMITRSGLTNSGGRWQFWDIGNPLEFEETEKYKERRKKDRLTFDMLQRYCHHIGLDPYNSDFYSDEGVILRVTQ